MGVNQLWTILEPARKKQTLSELSGKTLCVDLSGWICEARGAKGLKDNVNKPHLRNLFFRVLHLSRIGVRLVFVVDGKAPELKWQAITKRLQAKNGFVVKNHKLKGPARNARVGRSHFASWVRECRTLLSLLGIPCIESDGEAEAMCAWLDQQKIVDGCITNDGDAFLYGARTVYKDICTGKDGSVECYSMGEIETKLNLNRNRLVAIAVLCGCDYLPLGVPGVGKEIAMKLMRSVSSDNLIDRFYSWIKGTSPEEELSSVEKLVKSKALKDKNFPHPKVIQEFFAPNIGMQRNMSFKFGCPHLEGLEEYCVKNLDWPDEYTREKVLLLITYWQMTSLLQLHKDPVIQPERIVKARVQQKIECYEVQWKNIKLGNSCPDSFVTIETRTPFASVYPKIVEEFNNMEAQKKSSDLPDVTPGVWPPTKPLIFACMFELFPFPPLCTEKKKKPSDDCAHEIDLLAEQLVGLTVNQSLAKGAPEPLMEAASSDDSLQDIINTILPARNRNHLSFPGKCCRQTAEVISLDESDYSNDSCDTDKGNDAGDNYSVGIGNVNGFNDYNDDGDYCDDDDDDDNDDDDDDDDDDNDGNVEVGGGCANGDYHLSSPKPSNLQTVLTDPLLLDIFESSDDDNDNDEVGGGNGTGYYQPSSPKPSKSKALLTDPLLNDIFESSDDDNYSDDWGINLSHRKWIQPLQLSRAKGVECRQRVDGDDGDSVAVCDDSDKDNDDGNDTNSTAMKLQDNAVTGTTSCNKTRKDLVGSKHKTAACSSRDNYHSQFHELCAKSAVGRCPLNIKAVLQGSDLKEAFDSSTDDDVFEYNDNISCVLYDDDGGGGGGGGGDYDDNDGLCQPSVGSTSAWPLPSSMCRTTVQDIGHEDGSKACSENPGPKHLASISARVQRNSKGLADKPVRIILGSKSRYGTREGQSNSQCMDYQEKLNTETKKTTVAPAKQLSEKENFVPDSPGEDFLLLPLLQRLGKQLQTQQRLATLHSISSLVGN